MTAAQFAALSQLLRLRVGPAQEAARLVLVSGMRSIDAAQQQGTSPASVSNTITRLRHGLALAQIAAGETPPPSRQAPAQGPITPSPRAS